MYRVPYQESSKLQERSVRNLKKLSVNEGPVEICEQVEFCIRKKKVFDWGRAVENGIGDRLKPREGS